MKAQNLVIVSEESSQNEIGWRVKLNSKAISNAIVQTLKMHVEDSQGYFYKCKRYALEYYSCDRITSYSVEKLKNQL